MVACLRCWCSIFWGHRNSLCSVNGYRSLIWSQNNACVIWCGEGCFVTLDTALAHLTDGLRLLHTTNWYRNAKCSCQVCLQMLRVAFACVLWMMVLQCSAVLCWHFRISSVQLFCLRAQGEVCNAAVLQHCCSSSFLPCCYDRELGVRAFDG